MPYTDRSAIEERLTERGFRWAADRDRDGMVSEADKVRTIDAGITHSTTEIEGAGGQRYDLSRIRGAAGNAWLRQIATDVAVYRAVTHGGRQAPRQIRLDYERALKLLDDLRDGLIQIPGLNPDTAAYEGGAGRPRVIGI